MPIKYYNTPPYYDDFDQTKNYLRVLFRPGYAVQARELTQLQTAIQAQIDRFGSHIFKDGTQVIGGQINLDTKYAYVKLESSVTVGPTTYSADDWAVQSVGRTLTGAITGITATVLEAKLSTDTDPTTLYVRYTSASTEGDTPGIYHVFGAGEQLSFTLSGGGTKYFKVGVASSIPVGYGTRLSVTEGVFFISGCFAYTPAASVVVAKYANAPSARVVYKVSEQIVTQAEDASLTDNAQGTPNSAAPGAHRYAISLDLAVQSIILADRTEPGIIQIAVIKNGKLVKEARTEYSALADTLAQRTYEESGNYTVRPFQINIREYFNDGSNGGLYTASQINELKEDITTNLAAETYGRARLAVGLEPAVAYVNGYRIELTDTQYIEVEKARDEGYINAASSIASLGNYVRVTLDEGLPDITSFTTVNLQTGSTPTTIGTARVRSLEFESGSIYRLYLFDVSMNSGHVFSETTYISGTPPSGPTFSANVSGVATVSDVGNNSLVYKLPADAIQSLRTQDGLIDTLYYVKRKYDNRTTDGSGLVTLTAASDEIFESNAVSDWTACTSSGTIVTPDSITIAGGGTSIDLTFTSYASTSMYIIGPSRRNLREKIKQYVRNNATTITSPNHVPGSYDSIGITDLFRVKAVVMSVNESTAPVYTIVDDVVVPGTNNIDILDRYTIDNGQRDNFYDVARIQLKAGAVIPVGQITIVCDYFSHQPGDYFSVDSYTGITYEDIPVFQSSKGLIQLRDAIDFRPTKNTSGSGFTGTGASVVNMVKPNSIVTSDIQYYIPRVDKIYVDKIGSFGVIKGVSNINPLPPDDPKDAMVLYVLKLGAYTFGPEHVVPIMLDNRRYTMRDIGKIEKRLSNVEYYTALSLLEKDTAGVQIFDGSNVRYKNGFIVDSFHGHGIGAVSHPDYSCSIDKTAGVLRPAFYQDNVKLLIDMNSSTNVRKSGPLLTLDYIQVTELEQPYASTPEYLNPFNVFSWVGKLSMSPSTDEWRETLRKPQVIVDQVGAYSTYQYLNDNNASGTVWNDWQTTWTGTQKTDEVTKSGDPVWDQSKFAYTTTTNTTLNIRTTEQQSRTGIRTSYVPSVQYSSRGDTVVEMNVVPYIRSRKVYFKATGMKPNTRVYPFFDGIDVSNYVTTESTYIDYSTRDDSNNYLDVTEHPDGYLPLITDATGTLIGSFVIPNTPTLKFRTGQRVFRLTSSATNTSSKVATSAEITYTAIGNQSVVQETVIATRGVQVVRTAVTESRSVVSNNPSTSTSTSIYSKPPFSYGWYAGTELPGGSLNPTNQVPAANNTTIANTNTTSSYNPGGTYNPVSTSTATPAAGFTTSTPEQSTSTTTPAAAANLEWTAPESKPPVVEVVSFADNNVNTPVTTQIDQASVIPKKEWYDVTKTLQQIEL